MKTTKLIAIGLVSLSAIGLGSTIANAGAIDGDPISATTNGKWTHVNKVDRKIAKKIRIDKIVLLFH